MATTSEGESLTLVTNPNKGFGIDASPLQRPGIPQERQPAEPMANAHWIRPDQQVVTGKPLVGNGMQLTPVFSTAIPTRGLSGALRTMAYKIPDYKARRWLLLMVADRMDVLEHNPQSLLKAALGVGFAGLSVVAFNRVLRG
jgi:hypothetical protein